MALTAVYCFPGMLDAEAHQFDAAADHLQQPLTLADTCAAPYERALTLLETAKLHAHFEARALLIEVRSICELARRQPDAGADSDMGQRLAEAGAADV